MAGILCGSRFFSYFCKQKVQIDWLWVHILI